MSYDWFNGDPLEISVLLVLVDMISSILLRYSGLECHVLSHFQHFFVFENGREEKMEDFLWKLFGIQVY